MNRSTVLFLVLVLVSVAVFSLKPTSEISAGSGIPLSKLKWGVLMQSTRPFYDEGGTARVTYAIFNYTQEDAFGSGLVAGGNGCQYVFTIRDTQGQIVWEPGEINQGSFSPTVCPLALGPKNLLSNSRINNTVQIPLIFQNGGAVGTLGDPLPAGFYSIQVSVEFNGPLVEEGFGPGGDFMASVPIQILAP